MAVHGRERDAEMAGIGLLQFRNVIGDRAAILVRERRMGLHQKMRKRIGCGAIGFSRPGDFCNTFMPVRCPRTQTDATAAQHGADAIISDERSGSASLKTDHSSGRTLCA